MPKHSDATERGKTHRHLVAIALVLAAVLAGGAAWASTSFEGKTASSATDAAGGEPAQGSATADSEGERVAKAHRATSKINGPRWSQHDLQRPTPPMPTTTSTPAATKAASPTQDPSPTKTPEPTATQGTEGYPTMESAGPTVPISSLKPTGSVESEENGQVIEELDVSGRLKITHDNVTVRNIRITFEDAHYGLHIDDTSDGTCPDNVIIENVEVRGTPNLDDESIAVYSPCPYTLRDSRVINVGSAIRITNGTVIADNFILANHRLEGSDSHRSAIGLNGGSSHVISGNNIDCEGSGCSGALVMYGDFAQVRDVLIENNLLNSTGSYCTYAGSLDSKPYPVAQNVRYINNEFGRKYFETCGRYGPVAGRNSGSPGFVWKDNTWADTSEPVK